jgi:predicted HicB family RNase H-like nuclease
VIVKQINVPVADETHQRAKSVAARSGMFFHCWIEKVILAACDAAEQVTILQNRIVNSKKEK